MTESARPGGGRILGGAGLLLGGTLLLLSPLRPSPAASVARHFVVLLHAWVPGILLIALAGFLLPRIRAATLIIGPGVLALILLAHPVCDIIPLEREPEFETVRSLDSRAQAGEPFRRMQGRWYQCKSYLARLFF